MTTFNKALFIYNENAGNDAMEQQLAQTLPVLSQAIKEMTVVQTASVDEANRVCLAFAEKVDLLIILGGDGTLHTCINGIASLPHRPIIAILPGGTSNDFSRMLNIPQNLTEAANTIVNGNVTDVDVGKSDHRYFLNFWGIGLVADTSLNIDHDQKKSFGVLSYFMSTIRTMTAAESFYYKLSTDGHSYAGDAVMIILLNGKFLGTQEIPVPSVRADDGKFDVLIIKNSTLASFRELIALRKPEIDEKDLTELDHFQAKNVTITTTEAKHIDMDGEIIGTTPSEITVLPKHIRMIQA